MDILAASYTNIGPFFDKTISVVFRKGKFVINAPVGTGKSFLFFDGPIFSLYKHASRPIRNRRSTTGNTQLLFCVQDDVWLVVRKLGGTKLGGDSVKTKLYTCKLSLDEIGKFLDEYTMFSDKDLKKELGKKLDEVVCSNEKEVEALLKDLLPPKEVVLSANFLMQDAVNIFELAPAERLDIFKHMFGFIGIDHAKDVLRDKRKEVQTRITVIQDMSDLQRQSETLLESLISEIRYMKHISLKHSELATPLQPFLHQGFFNDLLLLDSPVGLEGLVCDVDNALGDQLLAYIQQVQLNYSTMQGKITQKKENLLGLEREIKDITVSIAGINNQLVTHDKNIHTHQDKQFALLQEEKKQCLKSIEIIPLDIYIQRVIGNGYTADSFTDCIRVIDQIIAQGKHVQVRLDDAEKNVVDLKNQYTQLIKRKKDLEVNIMAMEQQYKEQMQFSCDKIQGPCPYVEAIKGSSVKALVVQQDRMKKEVADLDESALGKKITYVEEHIKVLGEERNKHVTALKDIDWKTCQEHFSQWEMLYKQMKDIDAKLQTLTNQMLLQQSQEKKQQELQTQKNILEEQLLKKRQLLEQSTLAYEKDFQEVEAFDIRVAKDVGEKVAHIQQCVQDLKKCIVLSNDRQLQLKKFEEEQTRLKHLYNLFSKELMLLALKDFLPHIQQIMNVYLEDVADYTVTFMIEENVGDKIALDIFVQDYRGTRPVKSLSGGQKSLLKLAWILSIASMMKLTFLFLDETITSLDALTTADVADVLHHFVQDNDMKFYVVTHAPQIQEIPIRDAELQIP